ncbi:MAG TPA: hypothetical protein VE224_14025 [Pseudolabrys sp.]|nr:hypothetical protein [Pseudolabrys sp.]
MTKGLVIGFAAAALAAMASLAPAGVSAGPLAREPQPAAPLSAERLATSMRAMGLDPDGAPQLRGRYYILHARDPRGTELRVLADADDGEILSVLPVRPPPMSGPADAGAMPRIIHVPQADDVEADDAYQDGAGGDSAARSPRERTARTPR